MDEQLVGLMQRAIDGEATPDEVARLRVRTELDPEARSAWEELEAAARALQQADLVEPPAAWPALVKQCLRGARSVSQLESARTAAPSGTFFGATRHWFAPRTGLVFAAGMACGLALFAFFHPISKLDTSAAPGTMLKQNRIGRAPAGTPVVLQIDGARCSFWTTRTSTGRQVEIDADSGPGVEIELSSSSLEVQAFEPEGPGHGTIRIDPDRARIEHQGRARYRLRLGPNDPSAAPLVAELHVGDRTEAATLPFAGAEAADGRP